MDGKIYSSMIPPVTKEFIEAMRKAFPPARSNAETSIATFQRSAGQQDVIEWANNFMQGKNDSKNTTLRSG